MLKIKNAIRRLEPYATNDGMFSRVYTDLHDLVETGAWLSDELLKIDRDDLNSDEVETFLINLQIEYIEHAKLHLATLEKDVQAILDDIS